MTRDLHYIPGDHYIISDYSGRKIRFSEARKTWDGFWVHWTEWEPRQPQDFVRGVKDNPSVPVVRNPPDIFLTATSVKASDL